MSIIALWVADGDIYEQPHEVAGVPATYAEALVRDRVRYMAEDAGWEWQLVAVLLDPTPAEYRLAEARARGLLASMWGVTHDCVGRLI